jgi:hypothetical protein
MICLDDEQGVCVPHDFVTIADTSGVLAPVDLATNESTVLEKTTVSLTTQKVANVLSRE